MTTSIWKWERIRGSIIRLLNRIFGIIARRLAEGKKNMCENSYDVTVIVPVYNTEEFVEESILSVLNEKELNVELLLIDDGSTDDSGKIIDRYADQNVSVKAFHQPNKGLSSVRNLGLENASGKYVCYLDSDDYYISGKLTQAFHLCEKEKLDLLFMTYMNFFNDDLAKEKWNIHRTEQVMRRGRYPEEPVPGIELLNYFQEQDEFSVMVCMQMAKRSMIEEQHIRYIDGIIFEDAPYTYQVVLHSKRAMARNEALFRRRIRDNSLEHRPANVKRCLGAFRGIMPMIHSMQSVHGEFGNYRNAVSAELQRRFRFAARAYRELDQEKRGEFYECCTDEEKILFDSFIKLYSDECEKNQKFKSLKKENKLLQKKIEKKQAENRKLRNSIEFKIGKSILKPFRAIKKLFK